MKTTQLAFLTITIALITACSSSKKANTTVVSSSSTPANTPATPFVVGKPANGIYPPGNEELTAIQVKHKDVTLEKLQEGYKIYTQGACINCHGAENIYAHTEDQWEGIIDDMAQKARISDPEKDAVYKYVLAIKATQAK
ncbi:MAG: cytochrome c [Bacteroidota bacterium]|nr:cytochrome c [Bacteroidota bacterium]